MLARAIPRPPLTTSPLVLTTSRTPAVAASILNRHGINRFMANSATGPLTDAIKDDYEEVRKTAHTVQFPPNRLTLSEDVRVLRLLQEVGWRLG